MVPFHCNARDAGILQGLKGLDCAGECARKNLAGMEQIASDEDKIDLLMASAIMFPSIRKKSS